MNRLQTPMNLVREKLGEIVPRERWPRRRPTQKEVSLLLFGRIDATLHQLKNRLGIQNVFDNRSRNGGRNVGQRIYLLDVFSGRARYVLPSISRAFRVLMIGGKQNIRTKVSDIIRCNRVFFVNGHHVVLSKTPTRFFCFDNLDFFHKHNLSTFRLFLRGLGYNIDANVSLHLLQRLLGFGVRSSLEEMMESFGLEHLKRRGDYKWHEALYVHIVSRSAVSEAISMSMASEVTNIGKASIRDYTERMALFRCRNERCFFIFAE